MAMISRRQAAAGAAAIAGLAGWRAWAQGPRAAETAFLALGDWGRGGNPRQRAVAAEMGHAARDVGARFTISTGDNFYEGGVSSPTDPRWRTSFEAVYVDPALQAPWIVALGNHDHRGDPQAQVAYSSRSGRWRMPSRYYGVSGAEFGAPDLDLFVLDTTPIADWANGAAAQLAWLDDALGRSTAAWKLVIGHHTIHSGGVRHGDTAQLVTRVRPILERRGVQAYVNGHDHSLQHIRRGAVDYITTGAGSEARAVRAVEGTQFARAVPGFAVFRLDREALDLAFRDAAGLEIYRTVLTRERAGVGAA